MRRCFAIGVAMGEVLQYQHGSTAFSPPQCELVKIACEPEAKSSSLVSPIRKDIVPLLGKTIDNPKNDTPQFAVGAWENDRIPPKHNFCCAALSWSVSESAVET